MYSPGNTHSFIPSTVIYTIRQVQMHYMTHYLQPYHSRINANATFVQHADTL